MWGLALPCPVWNICVVMILYDFPCCYGSLKNMCISRTVWALGRCQWYEESCFAGDAVSRDGWIVATNSQAGHS